MPSGMFFYGLQYSLLYNSLRIRLFPPLLHPPLFIFQPTPDLTTRKRSHFSEVTSMRVPCWVVTFNFLRPFMSKTRQPRKLPTLYYTRPRATPPGAATVYKPKKKWKKSKKHLCTFYIVFK